MQLCCCDVFEREKKKNLPAKVKSLQIILKNSALTFRRLGFFNYILLQTLSLLNKVTCMGLMILPESPIIQLLFHPKIHQRKVLKGKRQ